MWEIVLPNSTLLDGKIALKKQKRTELKVMQTSMQTRPEIHPRCISPLVGEMYLNKT